MCYSSSIKQAAYQGMHSEFNDTSPNIDKSNLNDYDNDDKEVQQIIDMALIEMNNGNYDKAILLLDEAKHQYGSSRAEELQELIIKLQTKNNEPKGRKTSKQTSSVRQRKHSNSEAKHSSSEEYKTQNDYTNEQLNLVKKINNCKNYYQVLSVSREATETEIKKAYKKLALHLHPDKNHAPGAVEAFKTLGNAMAILTDAKKRKEYDLSGGDYITSNGNSSNCHHSSYHQYYSHSHDHHHSSSEASFSGGEEFTAEELFHMFFGNYPSSQTYYRRRPYQSANQRQPQEQGQQPSLAFGLLLVMILLSMFMSLFSTDPLYSLSHSR